MRSIRYVLLSTLLLKPSHAAASSSPKSGSVPATSSTCPSRTVNYITHGLPQQCLASSRNTTVTGTTSAASLASSKAPSTARDATRDGGRSETTVSTSVSSSEEAETSSGVWPLPISLENNTVTDAAGQDDRSSAIFETKASPTPSPRIAEDLEEDSLLDNAHFLSFEDWKKQNLVKAGQSEHVGAGRQSEHRDSGKRVNPALQQGLDALGDDAEIDLDFTGFVSDRPDLAPPKQPIRSVPGDNALEGKPEPAIPDKPRSKDAGTTCKERYNYASFDCAATILKTNGKAQGEKFVLLENKDSYMLNECSVENKFLIFELCDDVLIDTIVLANFEFFSSIFRTFRVSVSDKYPVKTDKWIALGVFEARNSREIQAFLIENPMIWARYVRIEFLTHYGNEFYCPLSLVRVHGTTMLEEYKHDLASAMFEEENDGATESLETLDAEETLVPEAIAQVLVEEKSRSEESGKAAQAAEALSILTTQDATIQNVPQLENSFTVQPQPNMTSPNRQAGALFLSSEAAVCPIATASEENRTSNLKSFTEPDSTTSSPNANPAPSTDLISSTKLSATISTSSQVVNVTSSSSSTKLTTSTAITDVTTSSALSRPSTSVKANDAIASEKSKLSPTSTQSQPASPTVQESFFKSVQKRLQMLESNSSLSLQYIEEQSRAFRDAFVRVEQKQLSKTTTFLEYLNVTVLNELRDFRQQYDQLWQSTVIELDTQREQYQRETMAINSRLAILADELVFQKRMSMLQMVLILICLGIVLFSRGPMHSYMDTPIVQSMLARSPSSRWMSVTGLHSPSVSPPQTRPSSSHNAKSVSGVLKTHTRERSDDSANSVVHHAEEYSPLTPISNDDQFDMEGLPEHGQPESPTYDPSEIQRPSTSPPVLPSSDGNATPDFIALRDETIDSRLVRASRTDGDDGSTELPEFTLRSATPIGKQLSFQLPE